jgi:hypothetical protein
MVKEDDAECEKRRTSTEKHKFVKDTEKKKEKRKNLECQVLEERQAKQRCEGEPEEESPDEDDGDDDDDDNDSKGMVAHLDQVLQGLPQTNTSLSRAKASKGPQGGDHDGCKKEASPRYSCTDMPLPPPKVGLFFFHDLLKRRARAVGSRPHQQGR